MVARLASDACLEVEIGITLTVIDTSGILTNLQRSGTIYRKDIHQSNISTGDMSASSVSFRHFCLGLLNYRPMAGYDVKRLLEGLDWLMDGPSFGTIYSTLHDLLRDELVTVEVEHRQNKPLRKVYSITDAGRRVLEKWVSEPVVFNGSLRAFAMRLILADNFNPETLIAHLQQRRDQVAAHWTTLDETARALDGKTDFQRLALEYGFALVTAELAWLDSTLNRLLRQPLLMEVAQGD